MVCEPSLSTFIPVQMPAEAADLKHHGFTVVDTSERQVFLQINHEGEGAVRWKGVVKERFGLIRASRCRYLGSRKFTGKTENRFLSDETMDR